MGDHMRSLTLAILLTVSVTVIADAAPAQTSFTPDAVDEALSKAIASASWVLIGEYPDRVMYFDKDTMKVDGSVRVILLKSDFKSPQQLTVQKDIYSYTQMIGYTRFNCEKLLYANLQISYYENGRQVDHASDFYKDRPWNSVKPGSPASEVEKAVCK